MKSTVTALLVASLVVAGCGTIRESRMNPMNWFGESAEEDPRGDLGPSALTTDNRPLVPQVTQMRIDRTASGAIVRAEAVMPSAGWWDAELVPVNDARPVDGVLTLRFVAAAPREPIATQNVRARTIVAAYTLSLAQLDVIGSIVVQGAENSRRSRR